MLELQQVTNRYQGPEGVVTAVDDVSIALAGGDFVAVRGPSGCGKTTLVLLCGGLLTPTAGQVLLTDQPVYDLAPARRAALRAAAVGFVFQQFHLIPYLTVLDNVRAASLAISPPAAADRAEALLEKFNLAHRRSHLPSELSTGERQRTALARALLNRPKLLLADEPTGNLDDDNASAVVNALAEFAQEGGAVLLVTHDARTAGYADRTLHMVGGRIV